MENHTEALTRKKCPPRGQSFQNASEFCRDVFNTPPVFSLKVAFSASHHQITPKPFKGFLFSVPVSSWLHILSVFSDLMQEWSLIFSSKSKMKEYCLSDGDSLVGPPGLTQFYFLCISESLVLCIFYSFRSLCCFGFPLSMQVYYLKTNCLISPEK